MDGNGRKFCWFLGDGIKDNGGREYSALRGSIMNILGEECLVVKWILIEGVWWGWWCKKI